MHPTLKSGQLLLVDTVPISRIGDIIVFTAPCGEQYVHRVVAKKDGNLITRGDNNRFNDEFTITAADVLGVVIGVKSSKGLKKVINGNWGFLIGTYRNIIRRYRFIYVQPIIWIMHLPPVKFCFTSVGDLILQKRVTIIRKGERMKLYFKKTLLGIYDNSKKEFEIRPVIQPFISDSLYKTLRQRVERI